MTLEEAMRLAGTQPWGDVETKLLEGLKHYMEKSKRLEQENKLLKFKLSKEE